MLLVRDDEIVERQTLQLAENDTQSVHFNVSQKDSGLYRYEVRIPPPAGEITTANNTATVVLRVVK